MPKLGRRLTKFLAFLSVIVLFASLLVLFVVFLRDVKAGTQFAAMWKSIIGFLPGAGIAAFIFRGLIRRSKHGGTVTHIVTSWLADEPLLHIGVWVLVVVELVTLSYFAPIYSLRVAVVGTLATPLTERLQVVSDPGNLFFNRESWTPELATFRSSHVFRWGDSVRVRTLGAQGYAQDTFHVRWDGYAPLHALNAVPQPDRRLQPDEVQLTIRAPEAVTVTYQWSKGSGAIQGAGMIRFPRSTVVHVIAKAPDYQTEELTLLPGRDTTLDFGTMKQLPGRLRISAFSAGGLAWHDMNVFVDGIAGTFAVDHWIELPPNIYHVRLERVWPTDIYYAGPFAIQIRARQARDCRVEYQVRAANTPTPAQGGGTPCAQ